jgi:hypothetical protein
VEFLSRSPILLLYTRFGIVPFRGRAAELAALTQWLEGDTLALALVLGDGGVPLDCRSRRCSLTACA